MKLFGNATVVFVGGLLCIPLMVGCPASTSILGTWDCVSYTPELELTSFSQVTFFANGEVYIHYPSSGNTYTLYYSFNGHDIEVFGEDTVFTDQGVLVISQSSDLTLIGANLSRGETWQTGSLNGGESLVVYSTETLTRL